MLNNLLINDSAASIGHANVTWEFYGPGPSGVEAGTWGTIKNLYR